MPTNVSFLRTAKKRLSHSFHVFFWHTRPSCTFSLTEAPRCLKLLIPASNAIGRWGDHCWIVAGMPAEQKQLIRASQIAAHKTPSAPKSPLSLCYVTDRERRAEWDCACAQNFEHLLFRSVWETYFCVRFESRNGRLKLLQSFWYTMHKAKVAVCYETLTNHSMHSDHHVELLNVKLGGA